MAARKRTIDSAPTMPRESTTLLVTAKMTMVVIMARATSVTPKLDEYITPEKVFLYTSRIKRPIPNAKMSASAISSRLTLVTFSRKLDLKMSWNVIKNFFPFIHVFTPRLLITAQTP